MQRVAEFMKQRPRIVIGQKRGIGFGEVADVEHDGPHLTAQFLLAAHRRTPCAGAFGGTGEIIADENGHVAATPRHFPGAGVGMVKGDVERFEFQPEQAMRAVEGRRDHRVEAEIGFQRRLIEIVFGLAAFFGIIPPVPWFQVAVDAVRLHHVGQHLRVSLGLCAGGLPDIHQKVADGVGGAGHFGFQLEGGETVIAQKPGAFFAQA